MLSCDHLWIKRVEKVAAGISTIGRRPGTRRADAALYAQLWWLPDGQIDLLGHVLRKIKSLTQGSGAGNIGYNQNFNWQNATVTTSQRATRAVASIATAAATGGAFFARMLVFAGMEFFGIAGSCFFKRFFIPYFLLNLFVIFATRQHLLRRQSDEQKKKTGWYAEKALHEFRQI